MAINPDEEVPVRSVLDLAPLREDTSYTKDEEEQSTVHRVHKILFDAVASLDKWHAFDLTDSELKIKQQIKAHQLAAAVLNPVLEAVEQALATIDEKFRQRNNR